jgi:hypothetical protein
MTVSNNNLNSKVNGKAIADHFLGMIKLLEKVLPTEEIRIFRNAVITKMKAEISPATFKRFMEVINEKEE